MKDEPGVKKPPFYKKKWAIVLYLAILAGAVGYLLVAAPLVLRLSGHRMDVQGLQELPTNMSEAAHFDINWDFAKEDVLLTHSIQGWAVVEVPEALQPEQPAVGTWHTDLIFVSDKATYRVPTGGARRVDVANNFGDNPNVIPSFSYGFAAEFSTLAFKNGHYRLYLDVDQGEGYSGLLGTGYEYEMDGTGLHWVNEGNTAAKKRPV